MLFLFFTCFRSYVPLHKVGTTPIVSLRMLVPIIIVMLIDSTPLAFSRYQLFAVLQIAKLMYSFRSDNQLIAKSCNHRRVQPL